MVLDDVPHGAGVLVEPTPALHSDVLGHRDLDVVDPGAVPDRQEDGVGEAEGEQVLDRVLRQVVIDAEHL